MIANGTESRDHSGIRGKDLWLIVLVFGSIWGFIEMSLGGFLHMIHFAEKGAVVGGLAIYLMTFFVLLTKKPLLILFVGIIAAGFKFFDAIIFNFGLVSQAILNPVTAILLEAIAFSLAASLMKPLNRNLLFRALSGLLAGILSYILYGLLASMLSWGIWPSLDLFGKVNYVLQNGVPVGMVGALTFSLGCTSGKVCSSRILSLRYLHPKIYFPTTIFISVFCWIAVLL